jgi:hypothetical protein
MSKKQEAATVQNGMWKVDSMKLRLASTGGQHTHVNDLVGHVPLMVTDLIKEWPSLYTATVDAWLS